MIWNSFNLFILLNFVGIEEKMVQTVRANKYLMTSLIVMQRSRRIKDWHSSQFDWFIISLKADLSSNKIFDSGAYVVVLILLLP